MTHQLSELLEPSAVCLHYAAQSAREVIAHLGSLLQAAGYVRETFVEMALAREAQLPTGLPLAGGVNAAIPHTEVEHVIKPGVALATLEAPVMFHNMVKPDEEVPVRLVFLLALDQPKSQIEMLQQVANVLQRPDVVARLMEAADVPSVRLALNHD
jgi:PTS system galactitol-specific IIA component